MKLKAKANLIFFIPGLLLILVSVWAANGAHAGPTVEDRTRGFCSLLEKGAVDQLGRRCPDGQWMLTLMEHQWDERACFASFRQAKAVMQSLPSCVDQEAVQTKACSVSAPGISDSVGFHCKPESPYFITANGQMVSVCFRYISQVVEAMRVHPLCHFQPVWGN